MKLNQLQGIAKLASVKSKQPSKEQSFIGAGLDLEAIENTNVEPMEIPAVVMQG